MPNDGDSTTDRDRFRLKRVLFPLLAGTTLLFAACASVPPPPVLSSSDPASPRAKEAARTAFHGALAPDEATQKTHDLIVTQGKSSPSPGSDDHSGMSQMPGMDMGGMK
jgi:hypothetical protein